MCSFAILWGHRWAVRYHSRSDCVQFGPWNVGILHECIQCMYANMYACQGGACVCPSTAAAHMPTLHPPTNGDMNTSGGSTPFWGAWAHLKAQSCLFGSQWYVTIGIK